MQLQINGQLGNGMEMGNGMETGNFAVNENNTCKLYGLHHTIDRTKKKWRELNN